VYKQSISCKINRTQVK